MKGVNTNETSDARQVLRSSQVHSLWETEGNVARPAVSLEYHWSFAKMMYVPIQTYQKLLNLISFSNMYFAILNCWWVRKCFNPLGIFGSLTNVFKSSRLFPQMFFMCKISSRQSFQRGCLSFFIFPFRNPAIFPANHLLPHLIMCQFCTAFLTPPMIILINKIESQHYSPWIFSRLCALISAALFSLTLSNWFVIC